MTLQANTKELFLLAAGLCLQSCPRASAAMAWYEIYAVTPRLMLRSEAISSLNSPWVAGKGHQPLQIVLVRIGRVRMKQTV